MIPNSVTEIGEYSFYGCTNLTSMIIPNSVTAIGMNAFRNCETLSAMTIPKSIKLIGDCAFANCINLSTIHSYIKDPSKTFLLDDVFYDFSTSTCKLYVPLGTRSLYQSADQWKDFMNIIEEAPNSILRPSSENDIHYTSSNGMICLSSDNVLPGVTIYDMDGKHVNTNNTPANNYQLSVPASGTYIMKIGKNMIKVLVK